MRQLAEELKLVLDITSRVDERIKMLVEYQTSVNHRLEKLSSDYNELLNKINVVESSNDRRIRDAIESVNQKISKIEILLENMNRMGSNKTQLFIEETRKDIDLLRNKIEKLTEYETDRMQKIKSFLGLVVQAVWIIIVCYLLYKFGLNAPPTP